MAANPIPRISGEAGSEMLLLSEASYSDSAQTRAALTPRWVPVDPAQLGVQLLPGESYSDGLFVSGNGAAFVTAGDLDGQRTLAIAFRGSDDKQDWINNFRDIDRNYDNFGSLVQAVDRLAATGSFDRIVATGHSLGGAMAEKFMIGHPVDGRFLAYTYGAPGLNQPAGIEDARVIDYRVADDPIPYLSERRAEIGATLDALPMPGKLAASYAIANRIDVDPPLTTEEVYDSIPYATRDYQFVGRTIWLEGEGTGALPGRIDSPEDILNLDFDKHNVEEYAALLPVLAQGTDGPDALTGSAKVDEFLGLGGDDVLTGLDANDLAYGNTGADIIYGNHGDDTLFGGQGGDTLFGGRDDDRLAGNLGSDTLVGGLGADSFVCQGSFGVDIITDFKAQDGDRIIADTGAVPVATASDQGIVLDFGAGNAVTLVGVASFDPAWLGIA